MDDGLREALERWHDFYVLTGSSAAALTGLVFVVVTLVADGRSRSPQATRLFSTPSVVYFGASLFIAAYMLAPLTVTWPLVVFSLAVGIVGLFWCAEFARGTRELTTYRPDAEDWTFNFALPLVAYVAIITGAALFAARPHVAIFIPPSVVLLLTFTGIHNAWDVITFIATGRAEEADRSSETD